MFRKCKLKKNNELSFSSHHTDNNSRIFTISRVGKDIEKTVLSGSVVVIYTYEAILQNNLAVYGRIKNVRLYEPAILLVSLHIRKSFISVCKIICRKMYIAALVVIGKNKKHHIGMLIIKT